MENVINNVTVSVVVPLYNQKRHIKACLQSIRSQTYKNLEIIVVNDGSVDESPEIAKRMAQKDYRIKVIDKQNEGTSFARRDGYLASTGAYLTFVDNDDTLPKNAIELMVSVMESKNVDMVFGSVTRKLGLITQKQVYGSFPVGEIVSSPRLFDDYYIGFYRNSVFPVSIWGRLFRKSVVDEAYQNKELFSAKMPCMAGDEYFNLQIFPFLKSMYRIEDVVYFYRYGGTVNHFNNFFPEVFTLSDKRLELLDDYNYQKGYKPLFDEYVASMYGYAAMMIHYKERDKKGIFEFFNDEIIHRKVMNRMLQYYDQNGIIREDIQLIKEKDFEGMYSRACLMEKKAYGTLRYKMKQAHTRQMAKKKQNGKLKPNHIHNHMSNK